MDGHYLAWLPIISRIPRMASQDLVMAVFYGKFQENELVSIQKRGILVEIKACEKFYHRHIVDIPRIKF